MALFSRTLPAEEEGRGAKAAAGRELSAPGPREKGHLLVSAASLLAFLAVWALAAWIAQSRHFPDPVAVGERIVAEAASGQLLFQVGMTLARVAASFVLAVVIGSAIGFVMGRSSRLNLFFDSWLILFLNLPALIVIILCFLWFGLNEAAAITAVALNKIPNVAVIIREGTQALSRSYDELATVYRFGWWTRLRQVHLPQLAPYFAAAGRSGLAIVWKIVLVVELLGLSSGVGFQLNTFFQLFDVTGILAYAASFIAVIFLIETFVMRPWQLAANRWRQ
jgi:NitT/TauT family transport system permease protein